MKSSTAYSVFYLTVVCLLIVRGQQQGCSCGNLGTGTNPCTCSETVVKAARVSKPTFYVPPENIKEAAQARSNIVISTGVPKTSVSNLQSISNSNPIIYNNNANSNAYISDNTDSIAYNDGSSNVQVNSDSNAYNTNNGGSSDTYNNAGGIDVYSNSDSNTFGNSDSITYTSNNPSVPPATSVTYTNVAPTDNAGTVNSGCGCSKQLSTPLELEDSPNSNSDVNIVPSFSPIGDLCYPLPIDSRSGKLIEKTQVTPAYPGKIVCNRNPSEPYEICINMLSGETTTRAITSVLPGASSGSISLGYRVPNSGIVSGSTSGAFTGIGSGSGKFTGIVPGLFGNGNSGTFSRSTSESFGNGNFGTFGGSTSGAFSGSSSGSFGNGNSGTFGGSTSGAFSGTSYGSFGNGNIGTFGGSTSGAFSGASSGSFGNGNFGTFGGSTSGAFSGSSSESFGNGNSGTFSGSTSRTFSGSQFGKYTSSNSGSFGQSSSGYRVAPVVYPGLNIANGEKQYGRVTIGSSSPSCFDDDTDETQVDHSYPEVPADAVSLTLAYKNLRAPNVIYRQGKQFVPEDKLSFGHRTVPNDAKTVKEIVDIPEERLVTVEKPVVELKVAPPRTVVIGSYDQREEAKLAELEAIERESITQEEGVDQVAEGLVTYKDLGYAPVGSTFATSYSGITNGEINDMEEPCGPLGPPKPDYVPGSVIVQQNVVRDNIATAAIGNVLDNINVQRTIPARFRSCPN